MKRTLILASALSALFICGTACAAEVLELTPDQVQNMGLKFVRAQEARDFLVATLPAVIAPPPNARVAVAATFPGVVLQTLAVEGEQVRRGQSLAIVSSREILSLWADLTSARARLVAARANAERLGTLSREGVVAGARAEEAHAGLLEAQAEVDEKSRVLSAVGADGAKGQYVLSAPIDGVISSSKIEAGQPADSTAAAFVVDAIGRYEVQAQVPERLIGQIAPGMRVVTNGGTEAKVTSVGKALQPDTRSAMLKAIITDGAHAVSGRTTMAAIYAPAPQGAVKVPRAAVTDIGGESFVFVQNDKGVGVQKVTTALIGGEDVTVTSGLKAGESVAVSSHSALKSMVLAK